MGETNDTGGRFDNDFKYVMQDTGNIYIGAKYSYQELLAEELLAFKIKSIITHYIAKESAMENTLESDFYYLNQETFLYEIYKQLKVKIKVSLLAESKRKGARAAGAFEERILTLKQLTEMNLAQKKGSQLVIQEIILSKLSLLSFAV